MKKKFAIVLLAALTIAGCSWFGAPRQTVKVYFANTTLNPNAQDCSLVYPLDRQVPQSDNSLEAAFQELVKGPTDAEVAAGATSFFDARTSGIIKSATLENGIAKVDFTDFTQLIPNASASCGSAEFLSELDTTAKQFSDVTGTLYSIDGDTAKFYEFLQMSPPATGDQKTIQDLSAEAVQSLKIKDLTKLSSLVDPVNGLLFSPYGNINKTESVVIAQKDIAGLLTNTAKYEWGTEDGSGLPISLTFSDYYNKFVYTHDFANAEKISYDKALETTSMIDNLKTVFPNAHFVEYYFSGFDPQYQGMDWESLKLVFTKTGDTWYLAAIVHNQWTP